MIIEKPQPPLGEAGDEGYQIFSFLHAENLLTSRSGLQQKRRRLKTPIRG